MIGSNLREKREERERKEREKNRTEREYYYINHIRIHSNT